MALFSPLLVIAACLRARAHWERVWERAFPDSGCISRSERSSRCSRPSGRAIRRIAAPSCPGLRRRWRKATSIAASMWLTLTFPWWRTSGRGIEERAPACSRHRCCSSTARAHVRPPRPGRFRNPRTRAMSVLTPLPLLIVCTAARRGITSTGTDPMPACRSRAGAVSVCGPWGDCALATWSRP